MATLTWLHLSDLHFRTQALDEYNASVVLGALLDDLGRLRKEKGLAPDIAFCTGDLAFTGSADEYALVAEFFDQLLSAIGHAGDKGRLFVVPGNHDAAWDLISHTAHQEGLKLKDRDAVTRVLQSAGKRRLFLQRLDGYTAFVNGYFPGNALPLDNAHYFRVWPYEVSTDTAVLRLAILGLNSAWAAHGGERDRVLVGEHQVTQALQDPVVQQADLRIALLHHPFERLREFDHVDAETLLARACSFILAGHRHAQRVRIISEQDMEYAPILAGASYEGRGKTEVNAYNLVSLDTATGQAQVHLREYSERARRFVDDTRTYGASSLVFPIPKWTPRPVARPSSPTLPPSAPRPPAAIAPAKLEANYLRRVQTMCNALPLAIIDPKAVERVRRQNMDLLPVYVALLTETNVPVEEEKAKGKPSRRQPDALRNPERETRLLPALEAAARERLLVLLGDPGSGKSTFANYLALCLAGARLERLGEAGALPAPEAHWLGQLEPVWKQGPLLPLQVVLRRFAASPQAAGDAASTAAGLWAYVEATLEAEGLGDYAPHLRRGLVEGGVLVLFDGLDEVADPAARETVRAAVREFARTHNHPDNRYLVTCRTYTYQDPCCQLTDFVAHTLAPLAREQVAQFIGCWYDEVHHLGWKSRDEADALAAQLRALIDRPDLAALAGSPLQLTMLAALHSTRGRLPDDRVKLYQEVVELLLVRWQEARLGAGAGAPLALNGAKLEAALARVAYLAHSAQAGAEGAADIPEAILLNVLKDEFGGSYDRAQEEVAYIQERAGLLIWRGTGIYAFPHRSYQEYLAGAYLARQPDFPDEAAALVRANYAQWREVLLWAVGVMARLNKMIHVAVDVAAALCPQPVAGPEEAVSEADWRAAALAAEALLETGLAEVQARPRYASVLARIVDWLVALLARSALTPRERAAAGDSLARLGDPRLGVLTLDDMAFCLVPAGPFRMGSEKSDPSAYHAEQPAHVRDIPHAFWLGRYPITNAQFQPFVADPAGYRSDAWWTEAGLGWRGDRTGPQNYGEPSTLPNRPVVGVTWYEAQAFCAWLTHAWREAGLLPADGMVRLPSEAEWEKAARGGTQIPRPPILACAPWAVSAARLAKNPMPRRAYPWGDEPDPNCANYSASGIGSTSAVGCFPQGVSPYGCEEMSGNVWEWCATQGSDDYRNYPDDNTPEGDATRVLRGGLWDLEPKYARAAFRLRAGPDASGDVGFRVVSLASPDS